MFSASRIVAVVLLAAVALGTWRLVMPQGKKAQDALAEEGVGLVRQPDAARLQVAAVNLELQHRTTGPYAGAAVPAGTVVARADTGSYCVQTAPPGTVFHLVGPGGTSAVGPCS